MRQLFVSGRLPSPTTPPPPRPRPSVLTPARGVLGLTTSFFIITVCIFICFLFGSLYVGHQADVMEFRSCAVEAVNLQQNICSRLLTASQKAYCYTAVFEHPLGSWRRVKQAPTDRLRSDQIPDIMVRINRWYVADATAPCAFTSKRCHPQRCLV